MGRFELRVTSDESQSSDSQLATHNSQLVLSSVIFFAIWFLGFAIALPASALTTSANIRAATSYAQSKGFCTDRVQNEGDCMRLATRCEDSKWEDHVEDAVEFGGPTVIKNEGGLPQTVISYLNADVQNRRRIPAMTVGTCFCLCGGPSDTKAPCNGVPEGTPVRVRESELFTREECVALCAPRAIAPKCAGAIAPIEYADSAATAAAAASQMTTSKTEALQLTCFTKDDCARQDGLWEAHEECRGGKGRCFAQEPPVELNIPIGTVRVIRGLNDYVVTVYRFLLSILAVVVTVMFIYGAFRYLVGASIGGVQRGKQIMVDAVIGMLLVLSATTILRTVNPALTNLNPLKVYMVNTAQNISALYCTDLPRGLKLADAGERPNLVSRDEIDKMVGAYAISPEDASCGHAYYVEGSVGAACEGTACEKRGKACITCAGSSLPECRGVPGTQKVCAQLEFGGSINYDAGRYPKEITLVLACANANNQTDISAIRTNLNRKQVTTNLNYVAAAGDDAKAGTTAYTIDVSELELASFRNTCASNGGFLGGFLAVNYNGGTAVLTPSKCAGGGGKLSGYANGTDIAKAFQCAITAPNTDFANPAAAYWSYDRLTNAAKGESPINCNFNLDEVAAPADPASKPGYCAESAGGVRAGSSGTQTKACATGTSHGSTCYINGDTCKHADGKTCSCFVAPSFGGPMGVAVAPSGNWTCR